MLFEAIPCPCFDRIEYGLAPDIRKIPVAEQFQVSRVSIDIKPTAQDGNRAGLLIQSLATVRIVPWSILH